MIIQMINGVPTELDAPVPLRLEDCPEMYFSKGVAHFYGGRKCSDTKKVMCADETDAQE